MKYLKKVNMPLLPNRTYGITIYGAPDCGGADIDEYGYLYSCPICGNKYDDCLVSYKFCPQCGQEIKIV